MRCAAITKAGERCKLDATSGNYCWSHAPENKAARTQRARRGGRVTRVGSAELSEIKSELSDLYADALAGRVERGVAAVCAQIANVRIRVVEAERRIRETEELEERVAALEEHRGGNARWG
jgi:hypothetical protein